MDNAMQVLKDVRKLDITTRKLVEGLIAGAYHSVFKGQGIEFSEIREYEAGDDIRTIDWKVTARFNKPFVKEFIEERDLRVYVALDVSGSSLFGRITSKMEKALQVSSSLLYSAVQNNDSAGLFLFSDKIEKYITARKGKRHLLKIITTMLVYKSKSGKTDIARSLGSIYNILKKQSVVFVISDFFDSGYGKALRILKNRHDVVAIRIYDKRELELPDVGLIQLVDAETGEELLVDTSDNEVRQLYNKRMKEHFHAVAHSFRKTGIDLVDISTDDDFVLALKKFFRMRMGRMMH